MESKVNNNTSRNTVLKQLTVLKSLDTIQLRKKWEDLYNIPCPNYARKFLLKKIAYRIQEIYYGGLSKKAHQYISSEAKKDPMSQVQAKSNIEKKEIILTGTRFIRLWKDRKHEVIKQDEGFEYNGQLFKSLSSVAREITGTRWNGKVFFGLKKAK